MKKTIFLFPLCFLLFFSCFNVNQNSNQNKPDGSGDNNKDGKKSSVIINNKSQFDVNLYFDKSPYYEVAPTYTVKKNSTYPCELLPSDETGYTVYIEYLIDIGNAKFPYWSIESKSGHKDFIVKENTSAELIIDSLNECESQSAYFYIENNTTADIYLQNGMSYVRPSGQEDYLISAGKAAVYEVNETTTAISFGNYTQLNGMIGSQKYSLPITKESVVKGNIYTISVNTDDKGVSSASLKAITPFNIDTQKKIWAFDDSLFDTDFSISMRPSYDKKSTIIMGTPKSDYKKVGFVKVDEYKKQEFNRENFIGYEFDEKSPYALVESEIVDFVEQEDGSVCFIVSRLFTTKENLTSSGNLIDGDLLGQDYVISSYDFRNKKMYWYSYLSSDVFFRNDSKNKLVPVDKDKYILVGSNYSKPEGFANYAYGYELIYVDASNPKAITKTIINSMDEGSYDDAGDGTTAEKERSLTSAYFDGTNLYLCGYENWEPKNYSTEHVGKIWKTTVGEITGKTFKFTDASSVIYSHENCLFFSMDGEGSNFVVCGEYKDDGKLLKGCFVSSREIAKNAECEPVIYVAKGKQNCWFNQLCQYNDKVVLCGIADNKRDGSDNPLPFVVAYDYANNKLWENLSFSDYKDALNIIPNTIGTYMLQLSGKNGIIHYVNADLLGNEVK